MKKTKPYRPECIDMTITGKAADKFLEDINKPPTEEHKRIMKEADEVYRKIKRIK